MHVGVARLHGVHHGVDDGAGLLGRGGVVEIDERLAVDLLTEDRKLRPDGLDVIGLHLHVHRSNHSLSSWPALCRASLPWLRTAHETPPMRRCGWPGQARP